MKLKSKSIKKVWSKKIVISVVVAFLIILGGLFYLWHFTQTKQESAAPSINKVDYSTPTNAQIDNGNAIKENSYSNNLGGSDQPPAPTPISNSSKSNVQTDITYAMQDSPGGALRIGTEISSVQSTGTCTLTLSSQGQKPITLTSDIQPLAKTSTCKGFTITGVPAGQWNAVLKFENNTLMGTTTSNNIVVK